MKVFKIRNRETGLFSTGGLNPKWNKNGKTWASSANVKSHITLVFDYIEKRTKYAEEYPSWYSQPEDNLLRYNNSEIVLFDLFEKEVLPCR